MFITWDDIEYFLTHPETIKEKKQLECKKAKNSLPDDFWHSFSAFSNTQGGFILLGVDEPQKNEFTITGVNNAQKIVDDLYSQARGGQKISQHYLTVESVKYDEGIFAEKKVIAVYVQKAENHHIPVHLNGDVRQSYIRLNTGDHKLSSVELKNYLSSYTKNNQDGKIIKHTGLNDINLSTLQKYRQYVKNYNASSPLLAMTDIELLEKINAYGKDLETGILGLTYAGLLMFGKLHIIRSLLPHYFLDFQEKENEGRFDIRLTCDDIEEGNLFEFYLKIAPMLSDIAKNRHFALNHLTRTEENQITESLREALINSLTHSDYFNDSISIKITRNGNNLIFQNPGVMLVSILEAQNGKSSKCRNAILHNMFRRIGLCEREGKGIETIFNNWRKELLTTPQLVTDYEKTELNLTLQDSAVLNANQKLHKEFGKKYDKLNNKLYKHILLLSVLNGGWINHSILLQHLEKDFHSREISLALPYLARKEFLVAKGEKKEKFYLLPWVSEVDIAQIYGKRKEIILPLEIQIEESLLLEPNDATLQANLQANLQATQPEQAKFVYYEFDLDEKGRIIKDGKVIINELSMLNPDYLETLKAQIPQRFIELKKKNARQLKGLVLSLCEDQFVSKRALAELLGMNDSALRLHLKQLVEEGLLELAFPQQPTHKDQSYRLVKLQN